MSGFRQEQKQTQSQVFAPQLRQSLEILQVSALELRDAVLEELQSNPVLEELPMDGVSVEERTLGEGEGEGGGDLDIKEEMDIVQKMDEDWSDYFEQQQSMGSYTMEDAARRQHFLDSVVTEVSLQEHIMDQAKLSECGPEEVEAIEYLVGSLDDKGFLTMEVEAIVKGSELRKETVEKGLEALKGFEPIGIGAKDVQECLLIQLEAEDKGEGLAAEMVRDYYDLLLRRRIPELAKRMDVEIEDVQEALEEIGTLDPAPGRRFKEDSNRTVTADASIEKDGDNWVVTLNSEYIPRLRLSRSYKELITKGQLTAKEKEYIRDKMKSGRFIISAIEQRQKTLERVTRTILDFQKDFFEQGVSKLHPLTMSEVGERLGCHETTVSRAIANKYLKTPQGLYPYKYFFTSGFESKGGGGIANTSIKEEIAKIIESEPPEKPYSDQKLAKLLHEKDIKIARRTVAKYREELGILSTSLRRQY